MNYIKTMFLFLFTASYFTDNWSYQNAKPCSVLVGDTTDKFQSSKVTTLEFSNKSLTKPHQSATSSSSGKEESYSRPRRSIDGHANLSSVSSTDSSNVDMHEVLLTTTLNTSPSLTTLSLSHGVSSEDNATQKFGVPTVTYNASVYNSVGGSSTNDVLTNNSSITLKKTTPELHSKSNITTKPHDTMEIFPINDLKNNSNESIVEQPPDFSTNTKSNIAYDPKDMQGDSLSLESHHYLYGWQKLWYLKDLNKLEEVIGHIIPSKLAETEKNLKKLRYDNDRSFPGAQISIAKQSVETAPATNTPLNVTKTAPTENTNILTTHNSNPQLQNKSLNIIEIEKTSTNSSEQLTESFITESDSNIITSQTNIRSEHTFSGTESSPIVTNPTNHVNITSPPVNSKPNETFTSNIATETNSSDSTPNAKHVLINLTISADDVNNDSFKPLYSLTVTVPTFGEVNEVPTVKITPINIEPTMPTNFNKPVAIDSSTKIPKTVNTEDFGGSCECSCPVCENTNSSDDFYDDSLEKTTPTQQDGASLSSKYSSTEYSTNVESTESTSGIVTDVATETTDFTTPTQYFESRSTDNDYTATDLSTMTSIEPDIMTTTDIPKCICPKLKPPPILILEGEVSKHFRSDNLLTITKTISVGSTQTKLVSNILIRMTITRKSVDNRCITNSK